MRCPGQDPMFWKPGDVFEIPCPKCGYGVEFMKYDVKRKCRCGHEIVNPKINFGCAEWCPFGDTCIESLPEEMKVKTKEEKRNRLRERVAQEMRRYFGDDKKRIDHALKVAKYAEDILKIEGGDPLIVLISAYLHDIGTKRAGEKYKNSSSDFDEKEGAEIAREILVKMNIQRTFIDEICDIISHHHHPREKESLNFQILYEADLIVNFEEGNFENKEIFNEKIDKEFKTQTGKRIAKGLLN